MLDEDGSPRGGFLVFPDDDERLSLLEIYTYGGPLSPFPPVDRLDPMPSWSRKPRT